MKLSDLQPNQENPRNITDKQLKNLKKALTEFGDLGCLVYNTRTNRICGGHQRIKVLPPDTEIIIEMKYHSPTRTGTVAEGHCIIGGERFKYRAVDWDEPKEKAANLAANKQGGEFDMLKVGEWLSDLKEINFDIDLTGFDLSDIPQVEVVGQCDEDHVPEQVPSVSVLGDLYELGQHRLFCGDSTSIDAVEKLMGFYYECECGEIHEN